MEPSAKPLVAIACICEHVLESKDGVLSAIRIVDTFRIDLGEGESGGQKPKLKLNLLIGLKSGDVIGAHEVGLRLRTPGGKTSEFPRAPVRFDGEHRGVNLVVGFELVVSELGLYWFDLLWGDEVLTRIPLKVEAVEAAGDGSRTS